MLARKLNTPPRHRPADLPPSGRERLSPAQRGRHPRL